LKGISVAPGYQPNSDFASLEWQRLAQAIARGHQAAANDALDMIVRSQPMAREMVERGRAAA
jgi:hypothetical protein